VRPLALLPADDAGALRVLLTDIDGTLTDDEGRIPWQVFRSLEAARAAGLIVVPVTGRPAGWCDLIARTWPVDAVIGENGGLAFWRDDHGLRRWYAQTAEQRRHNRARLDAIGALLLRDHPGAALASDQASRELDLAIDFCEDVAPLPWGEVDRIVAALEREGLHVKVSNIHVNAWFGEHDKSQAATSWLGPHLGLDLLGVDRGRAIFFGDSPNDSPLFATFPQGVGVANILEFGERVPTPPRWVTQAPRWAGFVEGVGQILDLRRARPAG
jgi:HAD superfamily hydrolase (TIGR01484 family)